VLDVKFLTGLVVGVQDCGLYFISVFDARIILGKDYRGLPQIILSYFVLHKSKIYFTHFPFQQAVCLRGGERGTCLGPPFLGSPLEVFRA